MTVSKLKLAAGNASSTTLASSVSNTDTSFPLTSDTNFGTGGGMVLIDEGLATEEFAYYTGKSGSALTIPLANRGLEGSSAQAHSAGATVKGILSATLWNDLEASLENVLTASTGAVDTTKVVTPTATQTLTNKTLTSPKINEDVALTATATQLNAVVASASSDGWTVDTDTWVYVSVDDPTGVFRVNADVTGKYSAGMRIKMTNGGNVIYGIITAVGSYSGGYTSVTFLHEIDPTDSLAKYLLANSAITANYYSTQKAPYGFPVLANNWTVRANFTGYEAINSPTQNVWYNNKTALITVPIGVWNISYQGQIYNSSGHTFSTLSTANNSQSDAEMTVRESLGGGGVWAFNRDKDYTVISKTIYYCNILTPASGVSSMGFALDNGHYLLLKAVCLYL